CGPPLCGTDGPRSSDEWANVATEAYGTDGPRSSDKGLTKGRMCGAVLKGPSVGEQFDGGGCVCCGGVAPVFAGIGGGGNGEWENVAIEAFGDSDRVCSTRKCLQGSGGGGCTDDVEFSGGPNEDAGLDDLIGEVQEQMPLLANWCICGPGDRIKGLTKGRMCGAILRVTLLTKGPRVGEKFDEGAVFAVVVLLLLFLILVGADMVVSDGFLETGPVKKSMDHEAYAVAALIQLDMLQRRLNFVMTKTEIQLN
nr:hypothetical protein [Tanacetum cinerariifolium]